MWHLILEPFSYDFMYKAIWVSMAVGGICALLSCFLILKGWSLIGDALSHSVVPGVALAYHLSFPFAFGAFFSGLLAALSILWIRAVTRLKEDTIIGLIFTSFFAAGLLIISLYPSQIQIQTIIMGNVLGIADSDIWQIVIITGVTACVMLFCWRSMLLVFFDEVQAVTVGIRPIIYKVLFFVLLSASVVAALQTVGAILVIAMVITPGATAYLLTDKFPRMIAIAMVIGVLSSGIGAYLSYFLNGATGGTIVTLQTAVFVLAFLFAPKYGYSQHWRQLKQAEQSPAGEK
ncbi:metal ABC transporter permease [Brackiella oedipodis]|uniref:metal ABC transporter permease n=1 Tax=Brackiella oedipodis TaxID=124225 RepID=UPI00048FBDB7|nr:metal ABC transporter permease [Brackiella oedipodis]